MCLWDGLGMCGRLFVMRYFIQGGLSLSSGEVGGICCVVRGGGFWVGKWVGGHCMTAGFGDLGGWVWCLGDIIQGGGGDWKGGSLRDGYVWGGGDLGWGGLVSADFWVGGIKRERGSGEEVGGRMVGDGLDIGWDGDEGEGVAKRGRGGIPSAWGKELGEEDGPAPPPWVPAFAGMTKRRGRE